MTPKEKAFDLVDDMTFGCKECDYQWIAKKCALRAVEELINSHLVSDKIFDTHPVDYWQKVKKEIEKL